MGLSYSVAKSQKQEERRGGGEEEDRIKSTDRERRIQHRMEGSDGKYVKGRRTKREGNLCVLVEAERKKGFSLSRQECQE